MLPAVGVGKIPLVLDGLRIIYEREESDSDKNTRVLRYPGIFIPDFIR